MTDILLVKFKFEEKFKLKELLSVTFKVKIVRNDLISVHNYENIGLIHILGHFTSKDKHAIHV